jgi:hypothetical protein
MVTKELIKSEIDKVQNDYLEPLLKIIKAFEAPIHTSNKFETKLDWEKFINATYGCLKDSPIERGIQGQYENRKGIQ